jgi:hypothetical protein
MTVEWQYLINDFINGLILYGLAKKAVEFFQRYPSEPFFAYIN